MTGGLSDTTFSSTFGTGAGVASGGAVTSVAASASMAGGGSGAAGGSGCFEGSGSRSLEIGARALKALVEEGVRFFGAALFPSISEIASLGAAGFGVAGASASRGAEGAASDLRPAADAVVRARPAGFGEEVRVGRVAIQKCDRS